MAKASAKKLAQSNTEALKVLHTVSLAIFGGVVLLRFVLGWKLKATLVFSLPMAAFLYFLEQAGRPKYQGRELKSPGTDLSQPGLTEYMHDIVYLTWLCLLFSLITDKVWYLLLVIPVFACYKILQLLKAGKQMFSPGAAPGAAPADPSATQETPDAYKTRKQRRARV